MGAGWPWTGWEAALERQGQGVCLCRAGKGRPAILTWTQARPIGRAACGSAAARPYRTGGDGLGLQEVLMCLCSTSPRGWGEQKKGKLGRYQGCWKHLLALLSQGRCRSKSRKSNCWSYKPGERGPVCSVLFSIGVLTGAGGTECWEVQPGRWKCPRQVSYC